MTIVAASRPGIWRRLVDYRRRFGWRATWHRIRREWAGQVPSAPALPGAQPESPGATPSVAQWIEARFPGPTPLRAFRVPEHGRRRVTMVTDSIGKGSLFGGVGTALILSTLLANRRGADLRIVTRTEPPVAASLDHVLQVYGLALQGESQFRFVPPHDPVQELDLLEDELVVTTSWWTTAAALPAVGAARILYLLQEDERMFYPHGDEWLRCQHLLQRPDVKVVTNTRLLLDHLLASGVPNLQGRAMSFEPAFPARVFHPRPRAAHTRRRFVFYARPNNARNLFFLGLEVIESALIEGILDPEAWEIVFVGKDIPGVRLAGHVEPVRLENLDWSDYARLIGETDLGLCLMATPHPSYPPLDMAASGAVVVSNRWGPKQNLSAWSRNILLCEPDRAALVEGLAQGARLSADLQRREAHQREATLPTDWTQTLRHVVDAWSGA